VRGPTGKLKEEVQRRKVTGSAIAYLKRLATKIRENGTNNSQGGQEIASFEKKFIRDGRKARFEVRKVGSRRLWKG